MKKFIPYILVGFLLAGCGKDVLIKVYVPSDNLLKQYEQECYNDSTFESLGLSILPLQQDTLKVGDMLFYLIESRTGKSYYDTYRWVHRSPTIQGFKEFLEGRK